MKPQVVCIADDSTIISNPITQDDTAIDNAISVDNVDPTSLLHDPLESESTKQSYSKIPADTILSKQIGKFNQPKSNIACPFLLRRGWCVKRDKCDVSNSNLAIGIKCRRISHTPKSDIPCPFLRRKGSCIKGQIEIFHMPKLSPDRL